MPGPLRGPLPDQEFARECAAIDHLLPGRTTNAYLKAARATVGQRLVTLHGGKQFKVRPDWHGANKLGRTQQRSLHMHAFIGDLVAAQAVRPTEPNWLDTALTLVEDWCRRFQYPRDARGMAFHDETSARRLSYWLRLYVSLRQEGRAVDAAAQWARVESLVDLLGQDEMYGGNNNHGMFQNLALLYYCRLATGVDDVKDRSLARLQDYFESAVSTDGVHKEHSPAYHYLIADNIERHLALIESMDALCGERLRKLLRGMRRYGLNIIAPDGTYPPLGDTSPVAIEPAKHNKLFGYGDNEPDRSAVFFDGGYAILRDDPGRGAAQTFAVLCASHHGAYHKHQDDLSLLLYADGWIIYESGPYGYDYKHPMSVHGYSSASHSSLYLPNTKPSNEPGLVSIDLVSELPSTSVVSAANLRYPGVVHRRTLTLRRERNQVEVEDSVTANDALTMSLLWQLAPGIVPSLNERKVQLRRDGRVVAEIAVESDALVELALGHGDKGPKGYVFPEMGKKLETSVLRIDTRGEAMTWNCTTVFSLPEYRAGRSPSAFTRAFASVLAVCDTPGDTPATGSDQDSEYEVQTPALGT
ncbi:heparinase II/III family protein [Bordetella sp. LUAb4]|uniref:heparinase II/III domain-containing protein n=1 Tax=Bordetella sp. LUAb4 TaxID=2843195 RepID=UPI001E3F5CC5|nr:heparinase II/III family protein [Bordetella sp. LUAb4]